MPYPLAKLKSSFILHIGELLNEVPAISINQ